jgi:hypothetical protein
MRTLPAIRHDNDSFANEELPSLNFVFLYDNEHAANAAHRVISPLLGRCLADTDVHQDSWRFEELVHPQFRNEAWELAKGCDLMLVVTMNEELLPLEVCSWIEHWAQARTQKDAALILLRISTDSCTSKAPPLCELPRARNLAIFLATFSVSGSTPSAISREPARAVSTLCSRVPERWGINE